MADQGRKSVADPVPSLIAPQAEDVATLPPILEAARGRVLELAMTRALAFHEAGRLSEAEDLYRVVLAEQPDHLAANANLARMALELQNPKTSLPFLKRVVEANSADMSAWVSYARALLESCEFVDVRNTLQQCRKLGFGGARVFQLAMSLSIEVEAWLSSQTRSGAANSKNKFEKSKIYRELCQSAVSRKERDISIAMLADKDVAKSAAHAIDLVIRYPIASFSWKVLAAAYQLAGEYDVAETAYTRSIKIKSDDAETHYNRGQNFLKKGNSVAAESSYREAIRISSGHLDAIHNLIALLSARGNMVEAEAFGRELLRSRPDDVETYSNLLFMLSHRSTITPQELFAEHRRFGEHFEGPLRASWPTHTNSRDLHRRLKIGFVSGDFRDHAVAYFIEPILAGLVNCKEFQLHAYYNNESIDSTTRRLMGYVPNWNPVADMNDVELAGKIQADSIDILFDLSGISTKHRLLTFARKPAPIQVSWIGYPGTTGLQAMDYYLASQNQLPAGRFDTLFTEKIVRLSVSCAFRPSDFAPALNDLPALQNGYCTFGSFNRPSKITEEVVDLWARLIAAVPGSRMILAGVRNEIDETSLSGWFSRRGIKPDRLVYHRRCGLFQYLELHHKIDICLDTFPYAGGTTVWHALWMGVPTLTLSYDSPAGHNGASVSRQMGLQEFVAGDQEEFLLKGVTWANRPQELAAIRKAMRDRFAQTAAGDPERLVRDLQVALRTIWHRWCAGLAASSFETRQLGVSCASPESISA